MSNSILSDELYKEKSTKHHQRKKKLIQSAFSYDYLVFLIEESSSHHLLTGNMLPVDICEIPISKRFLYCSNVLIHVIWLFVGCYSLS